MEEGKKPPNAGLYTTLGRNKLQVDSNVDSRGGAETRISILSGWAMICRQTERQEKEKSTLYMESHMELELNVEDWRGQKACPCLSCCADAVESMSNLYSTHEFADTTRRNNRRRPRMQTRRRRRQSNAPHPFCRGRKGKEEKEKVHVV